MYGAIIDNLGVRRPLWSGMIGAGQAEDEAIPRLEGRHGVVSVIVAIGKLTEQALLDLAILVMQESRRPGNAAILLVIGSSVGQLSGLRFVGAIIDECNESIPIVAYVYACCGAGMWLAHRCRAVYGSPLSLLGLAHCGFECGKVDDKSTASLLADMRYRRPFIDLATWLRLANGIVNGEQAEALKLVDGLVGSPTDVVERWQGYGK